ncbi:unnamed protein product [Lactuca virosa]|uniref:Uncharacterized protein n=1 Tax=Lactuca virosa TaxID=75947 RepID=A0AAU9NWA1_9ASTR|nr:unnamed protein product [Lactuca virosa]
MVDINEDYEEKYKKLFASLKRQNFDVNILITKVENWVDGEESSDEDKGKDKCLMAHTDALVIDEGRNRPSSFDVNMDKAAKDSKMIAWDSSSL